MPEDQKPTPNVYVSIDIETTGPIPGRNAMLSLGAVAYSSLGIELSDFSINLQMIDNMAWHGDTLEWWNKQSDRAWLAATRYPVYPPRAMNNFLVWLSSLKGFYATAPRVVFVAFPTSYDWPFVTYYFHTYCSFNTKFHNCIDIKTLASVAMGVPYNEATKSNMPSHWFPPNFEEHTHVAVEDAREQGYIYFKIMEELRGRSNV